MVLKVITPSTSSYALLVPSKHIHVRRFLFGTFDCYRSLPEYSSNSCIYRKLEEDVIVLANTALVSLRTRRNL